MMDVLELMSSGQLKVGGVITKILPLSQYEEGFSCAANGLELKVVFGRLSNFHISLNLFQCHHLLLYRKSRWLLM